ncbi:hypothetical protein D3C78_720960 [compost metagenome]
MQGIGNPGVAHQRRQPEGDRVLAHDHAEVDRGQQPQAAIADERGRRGMGDLVLLILGQFLADQRLLFRVEPGGIVDAVLQVAEHQQAHHHGGNGLDEEHPLPARPALHAGEALHDPARQRATDHAR